MAYMTLTFLTMPPSTNHIYGRRSKGVYTLDWARNAKDTIAWEARSQYRGKPMTSMLAVSVALYWGDRRKHDVDNIKALLDALTGILWEDDGQIVDLHILKDYDEAQPRGWDAGMASGETEKIQKRRA